jgi:beta-galactosidase
MDNTRAETLTEQVTRALTRRSALQAGAIAGIAVALSDGSPADAAAASPVRSEVSFDEGWRFLRGDPTGAHAIAFNDRQWRTLDVPHDWRIEDLPGEQSDDGAATADPSAFAFQTEPSLDGTPPDRIGPHDINAIPQPVPSPTHEGRSQGWTVGAVGWYRKHFTLPNLGDSRRVELRFDGVHRIADVWLNGHKLGTRPYGYLSFAYDLTPYLRRGEPNVLAVRVDSSGQSSRWYAGSGIYRHTWLTVTGPVRIPLFGTFVTTPVATADRAAVAVTVRVENHARRSNVKLRVTIRDQRGRAVASRILGRKTLRSGQSRVFTGEVHVAKPALWTPETPHLYTAHCEVVQSRKVVDRTSTTFGIRTIVFDPQDGMRLNGRPYRIQGGNVHHDNGALGAVSLSRSDERRIERLKAAGFNAIRTAHNPVSPSMLDACDRLGMFVFNEFADMWTGSKAGPEDYSAHFEKWWQRDLRDWVRRDRNHPSVLLWSTGNEIGIFNTEPQYAKYGPLMIKRVKTLDPTRPVLIAGAQGGDSDPAYDWSDILDIHYNLDDPTTIHDNHPHKAMTRSEMDTTTMYDDWKFENENPWCVGSWVWTAWDYIGEAGVGAPLFGPTREIATARYRANLLGAIPYPWYSSFQGELDLIGERKPANYWRAVIYGRSPIEMLVERPAPLGQQQFASDSAYYDELKSWTWDVAAGQSMRVRVYNAGDRVTLTLNGTVVGTQDVAEKDKRVTVFDVPYVPGRLVAVASRHGKEIGRRTLTTTGAAAAIRLRPDVRRLTTSRDDLAHVLAEVVDSSGRRVPDAVVRVAFKCGGAGDLVAVGTGNPHNVDSFQRGRRWTWHGQSLAIIRPAKKPGLVILTATAPGLAPATVTLPVDRR